VSRPTSRARPRDRREGLSPGVVALRPAEPGDCRNIWSWRNDEETRRASFDSSFIDFSDHQRWFLDSLQNSKRKIYVVTAGDREAGVVRLDITEGQATVSIFLAPDCRGHGIGPEALRAVEERAGQDLQLNCLVASVKPDNYASLSAFKTAGFTFSRTGPTVTLVKLLRVGEH